MPWWITVLQLNPSDCVLGIPGFIGGESGTNELDVAFLQLPCMHEYERTVFCSECTSRLTTSRLLLTLL